MVSWRQLREQHDPPRNKFVLGFCRDSAKNTLQKSTLFIAKYFSSGHTLRCRALCMVVLDCHNRHTSWPRDIGVRLGVIRPRGLAVVEVQSPVCHTDGSQHVWGSCVFNFDIARTVVLVVSRIRDTACCAVDSDCSRIYPFVFVCQAAPQ